MLIIEWLMFVGAAIGTFVLGTPIAVALAGQHRWVHPAARDASSRKPRTVVVRAYAPLDLGIDPVRWPSERLWDLKSTLKIPEWPSKSWDDEHFGKQGKHHTVHDGSEQGFHAMATRHHREEGSGEAVPKPQTQAARERPSVQQRRQRQSGEEPRHRQQQPAAGAQKAPAPVAARPAVQAPAQAGPAMPASRNKPPDEAEIEHLIASVGLAGTVQAIMQRTGWEFRDAAQYLARIRRNP